MSETKWPIRPDHITNDGSTFPEGSPHRKLTGQGIIPNRYMQGMQSSICSALKNPTTIIEFSPEKEPVRTDSDVLFFAMTPSCTLFRKCTDHFHCIQADQIQAIPFCGATRENLVSRLKEYRKGNQHFAAWLSDRDLKYAVRLKDNRPFLEYDCPLLGFRELVFPVFFEDRVLAAFFVGQICLEEKLPLIQKKHKQQDKTLQMVCRDRPDGIHPDRSLSAKQQVTTKLTKWLKTHPECILSEAVKEENVVNRACSELAHFEETLKSQMELQREYFVRTRIDKHTADFQAGLSTFATTSKRSLPILWTNVRDRLLALVNDFRIQYFIAFGIKRFSGPAKDFRDLEVIGHGGVLPTELENVDIDSLRFDLTGLAADVFHASCTSAEQPVLLDKIRGIKAPLDREHHRLRLIPVPLVPQGSLAILFGYYPDNPHTAVVNRTNAYLDRTLTSFYGLVALSLSSLLAAVTQSNLDTALRVFGHEMGQLNIGIDGLRQILADGVQKLLALREDEQRHVIRDLDAYMQNLVYLTDNAKALIQPPVPKTIDFRPFDKLLFMWAEVYRSEAARKKVRILVYKPRSDDLSRSEIIADPLLLQQLLYNLVNNAVKYCYRGTNILLDCKKPDCSDSSPHVFKVVNYGIEMAKCEPLYDLFGRGDNVASREGIGVGLFIARRIAEAHKGTLTHDCEQISPYNVPMLQAYIAMKKPLEPSAVVPYERELERLAKSGVYEQCIAMNSQKKPVFACPVPSEVVETINQPTWKVTLMATIPNERTRK